MNKKAGNFLSDMINRGGYLECARQTHQTWLDTKTAQGWRYGPTRDEVNKTNPLMVSFADLPPAVRGQNSLTPYAVVNFFRITAAENSLPELAARLEQLLSGQNPGLLEQLGEYVHSHFVAAQLAKGDTGDSRNDMLVYEALTDEVKSWDTQLALGVVKFLRQQIG